MKNNSTLTQITWILDYLSARLDRLPQQVQKVVQVAAVLGRGFEVRVLAGVLRTGEASEPLPAQLAGALAAAKHESIWSALSETRYIFNHALLRDVAYNMQLQSRRQELHALAFDALRDLFGSEIRRHYRELAYHCEQAARAAEARRYLLLAADAARDDYQNAQALDLYRRALAFLPATDLKEQYLLHRECEKIVAELGSLDEWTQEIDALQSRANAMDDPGTLAEVMLLRSHLMNSGGDYEKAGELADPALMSLLLSCSARIDEINILRRQPDRVKGGGLARATEAKVISLILSDVIGNPLEAIASGPNVPKPDNRRRCACCMKKFGIEIRFPDQSLRI